MRLTAIELSDTGKDLRTFTCPACGRVQRHIFESAVTEAWLEPNRRAVQSDRENAVTHEIIEGVRLDHARNLLESTDIALKSVAFDCGFATPERMRGAFQRRLGVSPLQYRESFRAKFRNASQEIAT
jgi:AraC-like DNA-binding protein